MRNQKITDIVYLGLFLTIIIVMSQVPFLGFIPFGFTTATTLHIPVIIACIYFGKRFGTLTGLFFGLASMVTAYIRPTGVFDLFFQNPIISVLPRVLFAFLTALIYQKLTFIKYNHVRVAVTALLGSLIHSVLVLGTILLVYFDKTKTFVAANNQTQTMTITFALIGVSLIISIIAEAVVSAFISTPVVGALKALNPEITKNDLIKE